MNQSIAFVPRIRKLTLLLIALLLYCLSAAWAANPSLQYVRLPDSSPAQGAIFRTALADLNHDGKPDLVRLVNGSQVSVQLGLGDGTFGNPTLFNVGSNPFNVVIADLNNDTHPDIIVCNENDLSVSVLLGNGNGTFQSQIVTDTGVAATSIAITDFNRDGKLDVIIVGSQAGAGPTGGWVATMTGNGNGTFANLTSFSASARSFFTFAQGVAVADLNGDAYPDFVVSAPEDGACVISFLNNRDGTFTRRAEMVVGYVGELVLADFNNDGKADLAVKLTTTIGGGNSGFGNDVCVAMGNGDGTFGTLSGGGNLYVMTDKVIYGGGPAGANDTFSRLHSNLLARDMDGDGQLDLVFATEAVSGPVPGYVSILRGSPTGTFTFGNRQGVDYLTLWVSIAELNGDGNFDFVATVNNAITQTYITIPASTDFVVTTAVDENDGSPNPALGTGTSLREALHAANTTLGSSHTITFAPALAGQVLELYDGWNDGNDENVFRVTATVIIDGGSSGVSLEYDGSKNRRIFLNTGTLTLRNLTVDGGYIPVVPGYVGDGGGLWNSGTAILDTVRFQFNYAVNGGAIESSGTLAVRNCTFYTNIAQSGEAGAVHASGLVVLIDNSTFYRNQSADGKANTIVSSATSNTFHYLTLTKNGVGVGFTGGVMKLNGTTATMINCILDGNFPDGIIQQNGGAFSAQSTNNILGSGGTGGLTNGVNGNLTGVPVAQLLFASALGNNGGFNQTIALQAGSLAINAGTPVPGLTTDERGVARPLYGVPDIGAYEYDGAQNPSLIVTTAVDETSIPGAGNSLREALISAQSLGGAQTVTFAPWVAGQTITLSNGWNDANDDTALRVFGDITIDGGDPANPINLMIPQGTQRRHVLAGGGTLQLKNLSFQGGNLPNGIGGAAIFYGPAQLTSVRFLNNTAGHGGGIYVINTANVQVANGLFQNNTATNGEGGGISNAGGTLSVNDSTFTGNGSANGGAIDSTGSLTVRRTTFSSNTSSFNGGALRLLGTTDIAESTLNNNIAANGGGGLISHGNTTLTNVTIANNTALDGGGAMFYEGTGSLRYVTLARNTATDDAGGMFVNVADVTAINTIVSGNTAPTHANLDGVGFNAASSNNLLNLSIAAAFLGSLGDNGGPTQTIPLLPGSPAFDAGVSIAGLTTDQRGTARPQGNAVDIGAFELVPSQAAAIPIVGPLGGAYQNSVQVSITSTSPGTAVHYTLDGSTPSTANGALYTGPLNLTQTTTVKAIAYGDGWLPSPIASVGFTVLTQLPYWRNLQSLPGDGSQDMAIPAGDGVANLLKYAFNLAPNAGDLSKPNVTILPENGIAGLPYLEIDAQGRLVIEFVRRKVSSNPGIAYVVETGTNLASWTALDLTNASVVSIDSIFERVTVVDPVVSPKRFGRVRVTSLGVYYNDFNLGLGPATLNGSATYSNQAIQLTDGVTPGQSAAVIFNGVNASPQLTGFTARFNLTISATGTPADGVSFAVGTLSSTWGETGPGTAHSLAVGFDTYNNGGIGDIGIHIWINGAHVAANATNPFTNGASVPVEISYDQGSGLTVKFNGITIFNSVAIGGFSFQSTDQFGIGARTGGAVERAVVDDIQITPH